MPFSLLPPTTGAEFVRAELNKTEGKGCSVGVIHTYARRRTYLSIYCMIL